MKDFGHKLRILAVTALAVSWWSLLYPELVLNSELVNVVSEAAPEGSCEEDLYLQLLKANPGQLKLRSRLLSELIALMREFG